MQELDEIKYLFKNNVLKIILGILISALLFYILLYFSLWNPSSITDIKENVKQAAEFKGYPVSKIETNDVDNQKPSLLAPDRIHNNFIVYGATEKGKTTFLKKYITSYYKMENVYIYCKDLEEWNGFPNVYDGTEENLAMLEDIETSEG